MKTHGRSIYVELLFKGEFEAVAEGLEQGLFSWEEMNLPHDSHSSTPLMIACQKGLTMVMYFLLERGVDPTLCNHRNQTVLHVSQPALQEELLLALSTAVPPQPSEAAWRGDLCCLQDLMAHTDLVDLNKPNKDGLTPLMLAVRDVDLFEGLETPWKYQPVEVVKELLSLSVDVNILDLRGHTALWYVSQIKSSKKEELLRLIDSSIQDETMFMCLELPYWPGSPAVSPSCSPTRGCYTPVSSGIKRESTEIITAQKHHTDIHQDNRISLQSSMEPKMEISQGGRNDRKQSRRTSSLPSLWDNRKSWEKVRPLHPCSSSIPLLPAPHFTQLSKSAPVLMEPPLSASALLQARANINYRLKGGDTEDEDIRQKTSLPTLCSRTPKHLVSLDSRFKDGPAFSTLNQPPPLKPISILPLSSESRLRMQRISRKCSRRSRGTRGGSEESNSSSSSSQEEEESVPKEITQNLFEGLEKSLNLELGSQFEFQGLVSSGTKNTPKDYATSESDVNSPIDREVKTDMRHVESSKPTEISEDLQKKSQNTDLIKTYCAVADGHSNGIIEIQPTVRDRGGGKNLITVNTGLSDQIPEERNKPLKMIKRKERKGKTSFQTNQSFNILAQRNQSSATNKRNRMNSNIQSKVKLREGKPACLVITGETSNKSNLPRTTPTMACQKAMNEPSTSKRVSEPHQLSKLNGDKTVNNKSQKEIHRDLRSAGQTKKPGLLAAERAKSAEDYVTYSDMFLKISEEGEGPAIYEMFATPIYENLRAYNSAEKTRQVLPVLQVKRKINEKQSVQKNMEVNRRKQAQSERYSRAKSKQLKLRENVAKGIKKHPPSKNKCHHLVSSDFDGMTRQTETELPVIEDEKKILSSVLERECSMLSVIEEVLSYTTLIPQQNISDTSHLIKDVKHQEPQTQPGTEATGEPKISSPAKPLINTWTSDRTLSPVYQNFLNKAGDEPLTDDLLRSLAEELISLERRDAETLQTENGDSNELGNNLPSNFKKLLNKGTSSDDLQHMSGFCSDDGTITWTKGEVLGRGAYGTVYCGLTNQGQLIAVKQVALDASSAEVAEKEYERLEREVDLLKHLHHTNIVGFLGTALCKNIVSIIMEFVPGGSISSILSQFGPLPERVFALYTHQILEGVAYLHSNRVIHRDLKGNNIMLMPSGIVKLIDFGCARRLSCLTSTGSKSDVLKSVHGTPYWMAPEVISETGHGRKSDIWSIGCTVFEMATGKPPLAHMSKMAALFYIAIRKGLMPSLSDDFSTHAKGLVQACLTRDPRQRPSAEELLRHPFITHHSQVWNRSIN